MTNKTLEDILLIQHSLTIRLQQDGWILEKACEHDDKQRSLQLLLTKGTKECDVLPIHQAHLDTTGWCLEAYRRDVDLDVAYITDEIEIDYMIDYFNKEV